MKKVALVLIPLLAVLAIVSISGTRKPVRPTEESVEKMMLVELGDYKLQPKEFDSMISYKMDETSYEVLDPIAIACQIFEDSRGQQVDVVVIAGDSSQAFHDQQICFKAQGWELKLVEERKLATKAHGEIPVSFMTIQRPNSHERYAVYAFRSPIGFQTYAQQKFGWVRAKLLDPFGGKKGYSYRFIGLTDDLTQEDVMKFATDYIDGLHTKTNGLM
jgi:hypothetical protein